MSTLSWIVVSGLAMSVIAQELGDFGVLVHSGWRARKALTLNVLSALTFPLGGLLANAASGSLDIAFLVPFAAGNFVYIGATDLIPQLTAREGTWEKLSHTAALLLGLGLLLLTAVAE